MNKYKSLSHPKSTLQVTRRHFAKAAATGIAAVYLKGFPAFAQEEIKTLQANVSFRGQKSSIMDMAFSQDDKTLYSLSQTDLAIWDWPSGNFKSAVNVSNKYDMLVDEENDRLFFGDTLEHYKLSSGQMVSNGEVLNVGYLRDAHKLHKVGKVNVYSFQFGSPGKIVLVRAKDMKPLATIDVPGLDPERSRISANSHRVVWFTLDGAIEGFDIKAGKPLPSMFGHREGVESLHISPDGLIAVSGGNDGLAYWDLSTGTEIRRINLLEAGIKNPYGNNWSHRLHAVSANFRYAVLGTVPDSTDLLIFDLEKLKIVRFLSGAIEISNNGMGACAFSTRGAGFVASAGGGFLYGWSFV